MTGRGAGDLLAPLQPAKKKGRKPKPVVFMGGHSLPAQPRISQAPPILGELQFSTLHTGIIESIFG